MPREELYPKNQHPSLTKLLKENGQKLPVARNFPGKFLKENAPTGCEELLQYFDATYVSGSFRQIRHPLRDGNALLRLRRMPPLFPPALWNVHDLTLTDGDRTNNFCEGWNNSFAKLVGHSHPTIWRLITHLKEDTSIMQTTVMMEARGEQPAKRVRRSSKTLQEKLKCLCTARQNGQKTVSEFLKGIGHCIRLH